MKARHLLRKKTPNSRGRAQGGSPNRVHTSQDKKTQHKLDFNQTNPHTKVERRTSRCGALALIRMNDRPSSIFLCVLGPRSLGQVLSPETGINRLDVATSMGAWWDVWFKACSRPKIVGTFPPRPVNRTINPLNTALPQVQVPPATFEPAAASPKIENTSA